MATNNAHMAPMHGAQNEPARASMEVEITTKRGELYFRVFSHEEWKPLHHRSSHAQPLNAAAEALLNPPSEVEEIAKRLWGAAFAGRDPSATPWECLDPGKGETNRTVYMRMAREHFRMTVEELKAIFKHDGCGCDQCNRIRKRIAELEAQAKAE